MGKENEVLSGTFSNMQNIKFIHGSSFYNYSSFLFSSQNPL